MGMDSRSSASELAFRFKLFVASGAFGAVVGGLLYMAWASGWKGYTLVQYLRMLQALIFDSQFANLKTQFLLAALAGALALSLPIVVFYIPAKKAGDK
jgi:hypothetical protein